MNFSIDSNHLDLRNAFRHFLRAEVIVDEKNLEQNYWQQLLEIGVVGFMSAEEYGGLEQSASAFVLIAMEMGYVALPEPLMEAAAIAMPLLSDADAVDEIDSDLIKAACSGDKRILCTHSLSPYVNRLNKEDLLLVLHPQEAYLINAAEANAESLQSIDPLRQLSKITPSIDNAITTYDANRLYHRASYSGAVFTAAQLLGLAEGVLDMATEYAKERQQFGKPIGNFQAVKHNLANVFVKLEFAKPVVLRAAAALDDSHDNLELLVSHAKIAASDAAILAAETAVQVYGAMGYTFEVKVHFWLKRIWALVGLWGDYNYHQRQLEKKLFEDNLDICL